jgi:hypothetical protein
MIKSTNIYNQSNVTFIVIIYHLEVIILYIKLQMTPTEAKKVLVCQRRESLKYFGGENSLMGSSKYKCSEEKINTIQKTHTHKKKKKMDEILGTIIFIGLLKVYWADDTGLLASLCPKCK